jgi:formate/nitrite transporter FocA (FNT family)
MLQPMNWKHWLSVAASAFVGGAGTYLAAHMTSGIPTTAQGVEAFVGGACVAGLIAVVHLFQPVPGDV